MSKSHEDLETVYGAIGMRLRMIREMLGLDQAECGRRCGLTRTSWNNIEAGRQRIQLHQLENYAKNLGSTPKGLLKGIWW